MPRKRNESTIRNDVLIIGGGVQGLWLLNDLRSEGYSAFLLERRELGGEQTCHSHVYLHKGHLYRETALAKRLTEVNLRWDAWLSRNRPRRGVLPSYFGFQNPGDAQERTHLWDQAGLTYRLVSQPPALRGGKVRITYQSPEICLDGESLVRKLSRGMMPFITRIDEVESVQMESNTGTVEQVEARTPAGVRLIFRPQALVLAAGAGNQSLLNLATGGRQPLMGRLSGVQQLRKAYMLIVCGNKGRLKPLTGVFQMGGLFIVSRQIGEKTVWLVSDDRSSSLFFNEDWMLYDGREWLPRVIASLRQLAPKYFRYPQRLEWGLYEAPKAEGRASGFLPTEERIEQFKLKNLWAVWPTKLTLAPTVSQEVVSQIRKIIRRPGSKVSKAWAAAHMAPKVAPERWKKTPLTSWSEFSGCYNIR